MTGGKPEAPRERPAAPAPEFALTKWYLDIVGDGLAAYVGYWVSLRWRGVTLCGQQHLLHTPHTGVTSYGGLGTPPPPVVKGAPPTQVRWEPNDSTGVWNAVCNPIERTLYRSPQGDIDWHCLMPKAQGRVELPHLAIEGWGYVERLDITLPVWTLPFRRLLWGRAHSASHCLTWIAWSATAAAEPWAEPGHAQELQLALYDGAAATGLVVSEAEVRTDACRLVVGARLPLRQGNLLSTVFEPLEALTRLLPRAAFLADERKWVAEGCLESGGTVEPATLLYEEIVW
jgi:hypothetical protein